MRVDKIITSYNDLLNENNKNTLDKLSLVILETINTIKNINYEYEKYKNLTELKSLNYCFNYLKDLLLLKFCCQIRDYSDVIHELTKQEKYKEVKEYINSTKFLNEFIGKKRVIYSFNNGIT